MMDFAFVTGAGVQFELGVKGARCERRFRPAIVHASVEKSRGDQAKELASIYGPAFIVTSTLSSVVSLGGWYVAIKSGVDVLGVINGLGNWLETTPFGKPGVLDQISPSLGTFALAYIAHKASAPLRFPFLVAMLPYVAKIIESKKNKDGESEAKDM